MIIIFYLLLFIVALMPSSKKSTSSDSIAKRPKLTLDLDCKAHVIDMPKEIKKKKIKKKVITPDYFTFSTEHEELSNNGINPFKKQC